MRLVLRRQRQRNGGLHSPGSTTDLGQSQLDSPDLALVAETILANELQLSVPSPPLTRMSQT
jgi:hypothetical protein